MENKEIKGGRNSRIGIRFYRAVEEIKDGRLITGKSKDRISTEKITNMIIRHNNWKVIMNDIICCKEEELDQFGK